MLQLTESCRPQPPALRIGLWLTQAFDLYALEPLRLANQVARRSVCQWQILSLEGQQRNRHRHKTTGSGTTTGCVDPLWWRKPARSGTSS